MRQQRRTARAAARARHAAGFSLVELVIVVIILAILASVALPRLGTHAGSAAEAAAAADLRRLEDAIVRYAQEHQGQFPGPDAPDVAAQLTGFTGVTGVVGPARDMTHPLGPYLAAVPRCPIGSNASKPGADKVLISKTSPPTPNPADGAGWVYNPDTGEILANVTKDAGKVEVTEAETAASGGPVQSLGS